MKILTMWSDKGGVAKTTTAPNVAAAAKNVNPAARVGLIDLCSDHGHLSKRYALGKEESYQGAWAVMEALLDPRKKGDPEVARQAVNDAVTKLRVVPGTTGEDGCIDFINVGVLLSANLRGAREFASLESARKFGEVFLGVLEDVLSLDFLVVDLPGMVEDPMVRSVLPFSFANVIPMDMRCYMNMAECGILIQKLRAMNVEPAGFLRTFIEEGEKVPVAQALAEESLQSLAKENRVPILSGGIPDKTTLVQAIEPVGAEDGIPEVGLYCMGAQRGMNPNQKGVVERAAKAIEGSLEAMVGAAAPAKAI